MQINFAGCVGRKNVCVTMLSLADAWNTVSGMELVEEFDSRPDNPVVVQSNAGKRTEKGQNVQGTASFTRGLRW